MPRPDLQIGLVTEALISHPLGGVLDWVASEVPEITGLEIGTGGYAPSQHCEAERLLVESGTRRAWQAEIAARELRVMALNAWGNPLHPDPAIAAAHDQALRNTIRLAAMLGVDRVAALAGCPAGAPGDAIPHFAAGGWLPYLEGVYERQWQHCISDYWAGVSEFARRENPGLLICLELHPGTAVFNVQSFERLAELGANLAATIDPSHFFWMGMDGQAVVRRLGARAGHAHAKDVVFHPQALALNGLLDRRWPAPPEEMPWNFAVA